MSLPTYYAHIHFLTYILFLDLHTGPILLGSYRACKLSRHAQDVSHWLWRSESGPLTQRDGEAD